MIGLAGFSALLAVAGLWLLRRGRVTDNRWFSRLCLIALPMPFIASSFGWIFTEMGRQPWVVHPNPANPVYQVWLLTQQGVSTVVSPWAVLTSMIAFTLLYAGLGAIWFFLMRRYVREGVEPPKPPSGDGVEPEATLSFAY